MAQLNFYPCPLQAKGYCHGQYGMSVHAPVCPVNLMPNTQYIDIKYMYIYGVYSYMVQRFNCPYGEPKTYW